MLGRDLAPADMCDIQVWKWACWIGLLYSFCRCECWLSGVEWAGLGQVIAHNNKGAEWGEVMTACLHENQE